MAAPLSTSCLQRWTLLQEAAQCSGVLEGQRRCSRPAGSQAGPRAVCSVPRELLCCLAV